MQNKKLMSVVFCSSKSHGLNPARGGGYFSRDSSLGMYVFAAEGGSLRYISDSFELEVENPNENSSDIKAVEATNVYGIVLTLSQHVFVWDLLRPMEGMRTPTVHRVVVPSKPKSILCHNGNSYIGLENGKILSLNVAQCAVAVPVPRFAASPFSDADSAVTCMQICQDFLVCGTSDGSVKFINLISRKVFATVKPPKSGLSVTSVTCVGSGEDLCVCYNASLFALVSNKEIILQVPIAAKSVFTTSVSDPSVSPLIVRTENNRLLRMDGPNWSHQMDLLDNPPDKADTSAECISLFSDADAFAFLEKRSMNLLQIRKFRVTSGLGPLAPVACLCPGSLSLSSIDRVPFKSIAVAKSGNKLPAFIKHLSGSLPEEWNAGVYEGMIISVFNTPGEVTFSIYSQTSAKILGKFPLSIPPFTVVTSSMLSSVAEKRWTLAIGLSSGQVQIVAFSVDSINGKIVCENPLLIPAAESVHAGAKIISVDTSLFQGNILTSVDENGMISFVRLDADIAGPPAHVAIGGERGACFPDPVKNGAYICMEDGSIERVRLPRIKKDGSEDIFDPDVWSCVNVAESVPLSGGFIEFFLEEGVAVRESGVIFMSVSPNELTVRKYIALNSEFGDKILEAISHKSQSRTFVVALTNTHILAFDCAEGYLIFNRPLDSGVNPATLLKGSCHVFRWAESLTPLLFEDRSKALSYSEKILFKTQDKLGFPPIQGPPLLSPDEKSNALPKEKSKGLLKNLFKKEPSSEDSATRYKPTQAHVDEARAQLRKNLEAMETLQDDADEMQNASADFLEQAKKLNKHFGGSEKSKKKKFFGIF